MRIRLFTSCYSHHELSRVLIKMLLSVVELFVFSSCVLKFPMDMHNRRISTEQNYCCLRIERARIAKLSFTEKGCNTKGEIKLAS